MTAWYLDCPRCGGDAHRFKHCDDEEYEDDEEPRQLHCGCWGRVYFDEDDNEWAVDCGND